MKPYAIAYIAAAVVFLACDAVWLTLTGERLYKAHLSNIFVDQFKPVPAALFYLVYLAGVVFFAVSPAFKSGRWTTATLYGALFGFVAYATYDFTNQATIKGWPVVITIADLCWGTALTAIAATCGHLASRKFAGPL